MEGQDPIVDFFQTTQSFLQATAVSNNGADDLGIDTWIKRYEELSDRVPGPSPKAAHCAKLVKDILIRLRKALAVSQDGDAAKEQRGQQTKKDSFLLTEKDREALERRLIEIQEGVQVKKSIAPSNDSSRTVALLGGSLAGLFVDDSKAAEHLDHGRVQEEDVTPRPDNPIVPNVQKLPRGVSEAVLRDFVLESLSFKSMNYREQDIEQAHGTSFDWIFNDQPGNSHPSFSEWLTTNNMGNIYWITGKPGSGKSTLIRYLSDHKNTLHSLHAWAGHSQVTVAGFYFWTSGSQEQRSQVGLLRSLLYQLLSTKPDLIPLALPNLWQKLSSMTSKERVATTLEWSTTELMQGLLTFLDHGLADAKLCLFVDGLDEFDGDHEAIIHFFKGLAEGKHGSEIKLCLSSRPWPVFERAFEYAVPNLKLQSSNFQDMMRYTIDKLSASENVRSAMIEDMGPARQLVQTTVELASGVFLWVRLAVGELIRRFNSPEAKISDMSDYLATLPTELDSLFEVLIFRNQSQSELSETSRLFQLVRAREFVADFIQDDSATSLSLWELAFAMRAGEDDIIALQRPVQREIRRDVIQRCKKTSSWALTRSIGLLEVHNRISRGNTGKSSLEELAQRRVTYLHRTVRDWIVHSPGDLIWRRLRNAGDVSKTDSFDPHLRLLRSYILQMKHPLDEPEHHRRLDEWYPGIALALTHARYVMRDPRNLDIRFIDQLEKTISWYWVSRGPDLTDHWARNSFGTYEERFGSKLHIAHPFLALCTRFGLCRYVIQTLNAMAKQKPLGARDNKDVEPEAQDGEHQEEETMVEETPLLHRSLEFLCSRQRTIFPLSDLSFVHQLLQASEEYSSHPTLTGLIGGVNTPWSSVLLGKKNVTTWIMVLRHIRDAKRRGWIEYFDIDPSGTKRWSSIVQFLLREGHADKHAVVVRDGWDPETSARGILGRGGILDEFGDCWLDSRLLTSFEEVE